MSRVLRARFDFVYQLALLSSELRDIFASAPPIVVDEEGHDNRDHVRGKRRKPIEGDCPICFSELDVEGSEAVVWCKTACGQNMHKECLDMWAATKRQTTTASFGGTRADVTCPYCRSVWQSDEDMAKNIQRTGKPNREGYVNVADQLGISPIRGKSPSPFIFQTSLRVRH